MGAEELISRYYESATTQEQNGYERGQIYWAPSLFIEHELKAFYPRGQPPWGTEPTLWEIRREDDSTFEHPPLRRPELRADEAFVVLKAKRRPVIIMSSHPEVWTYRSGQRREEVFLVIPMFSFEEDPVEFKLRMKALSYRELFYLAEDAVLGMEEGFARFDRSHVVAKKWLRRRGVRLSADALDVMTEWFNFFLTGKASDFIIEYRNDLQATLKETLADAGM